MGENEPRHWLRLTYACNNRCGFCLDSGHPSPGPVPKARLLSELRRARRAGISRLVLSGGEPTTHPDFIAVVRAAAKLGFTHVQVITNGRRFCAPKFLDGCLEAGLGEATFSMHGHTAALHDGLTGVPGSFVQALAGLLNALKRRELIVSVDVVLNRRNAGVLPDLLRFYIRLGVREFDLLQLIPFGRSWENWDELSYDPAGRSDALRRAFELCREEGVRVWTNRLAPRYLEGFEHLIQSPGKIHDEVRGRKAIFDGWVRKGRAPDCRGARCAHCFLRGFCDDLLLLQDEGELRSHPVPDCLKGRLERTAVSFTRKEAGKDIQAWTRFYIEQRYNVKGKGCARCAADARCAGAPVDFVREHGFKALRPLSKSRSRPKRNPRG